MFKPVRICLIGATGMVGAEMIEQATERRDIRLVGVARREVKLPAGARMEMLLADPRNWADAIAASAAKVLVCVIGASQAQLEGDEAAFRAVNLDLVVRCAKAAKAAKMEHMIVLSAAGAHIAHKDFYLHVRGKMEDSLAKIHFRRLDILRPVEVSEGGGAGVIANLFRKSRGIPVDKLARAIFALAKESRGGRLIHDQAQLLKLARQPGAERLRA